MENGSDEEAVAVIRHTGVGAIPGQKGSEKGKQAASLDDLLVRLAVDSAHVSDTKEEEGNVDAYEEGAEHDG